MRWLITVLAVAGLAIVGALVFLPADTSRINENNPLLIDPFGGSIAWYSDQTQGTAATVEKSPAEEIRPGTVVEEAKGEVKEKAPEKKPEIDPFFYLWP